MKAAAAKTAAKLSNGNDFDIAYAPLSWWRERWQDREIQKLFIENFVMINDAFDENKLVTMRLNAIQKHLLMNLTGKDVIIKSRRQGLSTFFRALYFTNAVVNSGRNMRIVPHDPDTEAEFRASLRQMYENLPDHLKPATKYYSEALIEFKDTIKGTINSRITTASVQPGHESKGRGQTITDLHLTEPPFWRGDAKKAATSLIEAATGGRVAVESTAFGVDWTHSIYQQGKRGEGGWTSFFFEWWWKEEYRVPGFRIAECDSRNAKSKKGKKERREFVMLQPGQKVGDVIQFPQGGAAAFSPVYERARITDEEIAVCEAILSYLKANGFVAKSTPWYADDIAERLAWRRSKIAELPGGEGQFKVEYPENDIDCFEQTGRPVIKASYLKVTTTPSEAVEGHSYLMGVDTSLGHETGDWSAIEILDLTTGRQAHSEKLKMSPDLLAYRIAELHEQYNHCICAVERNNTGIATIRELQKLIGEEFIFRYLDRALNRKVEDGDLTQDQAFELAEFGLPTTAANKADYAICLEQAIRTGEIGLSSEGWCEEARTVVWFDNGKWGAMSGYHDDRFIALALANYVRVKLLGQFVGYVGVLPEV